MPRGGGNFSCVPGGERAWRDSFKSKQGQVGRTRGLRERRDNGSNELTQAPVPRATFTSRLYLSLSPLPLLTALPVFSAQTLLTYHPAPRPPILFSLLSSLPTPRHLPARFLLPYLLLPPPSPLVRHLSSTAPSLSILLSPGPV